jgi:hypothetical protein
MLKVIRKKNSKTLVDDKINSYKKFNQISTFELEVEDDSR